MVCQCLQIRVPELVEAIVSLDLRTLKEVRCHTGAGDGCTACHAEIRKYLEKAARLRENGFHYAAK
jgi:bacterioferritin-associated ferredoxin